MHIWLSQSLDIPNSTVCISLLEQIFESIKNHFWWAAFINNVVISLSLNFRGYNLLSIWSQLKARLLWFRSLKKSSDFSKIISKKFEKIQKSQKTGIFFKIFFLFFYFYRLKKHKKWFGFYRFGDKTHPTESEILHITNKKTAQKAVDFRIDT